MDKRWGLSSSIVAYPEAKATINQMDQPMTQRIPPAFFKLIVACWMVCLVGCESKPTLVPAGGNVTLDGKPLGLGRILFEPVAGDEQGAAALGDIQEDGSFRLFTHEADDGVQPGTYYPTVMDPKEDEAAPKSRRVGLIQLNKTHFTVTLDGPNEFEVSLTKEDVNWAVRDD